MSEFRVSDAGQQRRTPLSDIDRQSARRQLQTLPRAMWKRHQQFVQPTSLKRTTQLLLLVVMAAALVYVSAAYAQYPSNKSKLPDHVADLRESILTAARSGKIEELRLAFDVSGTVPDLGVSPRSDPIKVLKDRSADPQGLDTLAAMVNMLGMRPSTLPFGNDIENNLIYVWPYLSTRPIDKLTPAELVDLYRLVGPELAGEMRKKNRWLWWRLVISADGSWTLFRKGT